MFKNIETWAKEFENYHIPRWDELPAIEYYMDQVIEYIDQIVSIFAEDQTKIITPSMINNYVKLDLIPPPVKKKYSKKHISILIVITILKPVAKISLIKQAINFQIGVNGGHGAYNLLCDELEKAIRDIPDIITNKSTGDQDEITSDNIAVKIVSRALAYKMLSLKAVEVYNDEQTKDSEER